MLNKKVLSRLLTATGLKSASGKARRFTKTDWYGFAGAEPFPDGSEPVIGEAENLKIKNFEKYLDPQLLKSQNRDSPEWKTWCESALIIADASGIEIYFSSKDGGEQGPMFSYSGSIDPDDAIDEVEDVIKTLKSGRVPRGFKNIN